MVENETVLLLLGGERMPVRRDVGLAVLERSAVLIGEGRTEIVSVPLATPSPEVLHLALGAQPIVLIETGVEIDPAELIGAVEREGIGVGVPVPAEEIFLDFGRYAGRG